MILEPRQRTTWLSALSAFIVVAAVAWAAFVAFDHSRSTTRAKSDLTAQAYQVANHAEAALQAGSDVLDTITARAAELDFDDPAVRDRLYDDLTSAIAGLPQIKALAVLDARGRMVAETWGNPPPHAGSFADKDFFRAHAEGRRALFIGETGGGAATPENRFIMSKALRAPDGQLRGVVTAAVLSSYFAEIYESFAGVPGARMALLRDDGSVLAVWPPDAEVAGPGERLIRTVRLFDFPIKAEVSWPASSVLANWRERALITGVAMLLAIAAFSGFTALGLRVAVGERRARAALGEANGRLESLLQARTEAFSESERRHQLVADALPALISFIDREQRYRFNNARYESWFGVTRAELLGRRIEDLFNAATYGQIGPKVEAALGGRVVRYQAVVDFPAKGPMHVDVTYLPQFDKDGTVTGIYTFVHDIGERVEAERQRELLVNELNHRVKNTLATVQSLALQSFRGDDPQMAEKRRDFEGRLMALARAHDLLTQANWIGTGMAATVDSALGPYGGGQPELFTIRGPEVDLTPRESLGFSVALHELATNAAKYGALSRQGGHVGVAWEVADGNRLVLTWTERGGPPVVAPTHKGFGTRLIGRLARELLGTAEVDFNADGVTCRIEIPLGRPSSPGPAERRAHD